MAKKKAARFVHPAAPLTVLDLMISCRLKIRAANQSALHHSPPGYTPKTSKPYKSILENSSTKTISLKIGAGCISLTSPVTHCMKESYSRFKTRTTLQPPGDFDHIAVSLPHFSKSYASRFFLYRF